MWTLPLALLGVIAFCSFVGEGSASDWSAVYMTQELGTSQALGAIAFAAFAVTMATTRFMADSLRTRFGTCAGAHGFAGGGGRTRSGLLIHEPAAAIAGFALLGLGLAAVVPIAFAPPATSTRARPAASWAGSRRRLRGLGGRPDSDRLAGGGDEPAHVTGPRGAAGADDRGGQRTGTHRGPSS